METLPQKLLRKLKEFWAWIVFVIKNMSAPEKQVFAIIVMVVAVLAVASALLWSSFARAEQVTVSVMCPKEFNFCYGNKAQFQEIMDFNQAMAKEIVKRQSCSDKNSI